MYANAIYNGALCHDAINHKLIGRTNLPLSDPSVAHFAPNPYQCGCCADRESCVSNHSRRFLQHFSCRCLGLIHFQSYYFVRSLFRCMSSVWRIVNSVPFLLFSVPYYSLCFLPIFSPNLQKPACGQILHMTCVPSYHLCSVLVAYLKDSQDFFLSSSSQPFVCFQDSAIIAMINVQVPATVSFNLTSSSGHFEIALFTSGLSSTLILSPLFDNDDTSTSAVFKLASEPHSASDLSVHSSSQHFIVSLIISSICLVCVSMAAEAFLHRYVLILGGY